MDLVEMYKGDSTCKFACASKLLHVELEGDSVERKYLRLAAWITNQGLRSTDEF